MCNVATCAAPVVVDHFDDLAAWTNITNGSTPWVIDSAGYVGNGAKSKVGGYGYSVQLKRGLTLTANSTVTLWVNKSAYDGVTVTFKVDGVEKWSWGGGTVFGSWTQQTASVPAGTHQISIETDFAGTAWVDEFNVFSTP
jgi:hypothetical protein